MTTRRGGAGSRVADAMGSGVAWALERGIGAVPDSAARLAGRSLGALSYRALRIRRRTVERQLADSFPDAEPRWLSETAAGCYRHFGEELAVLAGGGRRLEEALRRVDDVANGVSQLEAATARGRGAIVVTGHLGNWELAGSSMAHHGFPTTAVARRQRGAAERRINDMRARLGFEVVYQDEHPREILRALKRGRVVALVADQHARRGSARVEFLGRPAWTTLGPARLCLAAGVPLFFGAVVRDGSRYRSVFEEVDLGAAEAGTARLEITRRWVGALERAIRASPEQYFWFHRRWKGGGNLGHEAAADGGGGGARDGNADRPGEVGDAREAS